MKMPFFGPDQRRGDTHFHLPIRELRNLMGDRRQKYRISLVQGKPKKGDDPGDYRPGELHAGNFYESVQKAALNSIK
jgi:hypothetical protein